VFSFCLSFCRRRRSLSTAFRIASGQFTLENIAGLFEPPIPASYLLSIQISLTTALMGGLLGFLMAYALTVGNLPRWLRPSR
jgi:putative spermidine/putrescine transport system permease protein